MFPETFHLSTIGGIIKVALPRIQQADLEIMDSRRKEIMSFKPNLVHRSSDSVTIFLNESIWIEFDERDI